MPHEEVLKFWFGRVEETIIPTESLARLWFADSPEIDQEIKERFSSNLEEAINGNYVDWEKNPRGQLALIIILDQFSRHIHRNLPKAFEQDEHAIQICVNGVSQEEDHRLSLIERVFYYFPLLHSENLYHQELSLRAYKMLYELAFQETRIIYESFFKFATHHYNIIQRFGRFPQRNDALGRESTEEEIKYLQEIKRF